MRDFNLDSSDINIPGDDDLFQKPKVCALMNIPCERALSCPQSGIVDCHMENMLSHYEDPLEILERKEEDSSFFELEEETFEEEMDSGAGETDGYLEDEVMENFDIPLADEISDADFTIFSDLPTKVPIRKSAGRRGARG